MYKNPAAASAAAKNFRVFAMVKGVRSGAGQWRKKVTHPPFLLEKVTYPPPFRATQKLLPPPPDFSRPPSRK